MESKSKVFGHPAHILLIVFPLGLLTTAAIFDALHIKTKNKKWAETAFYLIAAGIIGGMAASPFGWRDWFAIPARTRAKAIGLAHGLGNVAALGLFGLSWLLRRADPAQPKSSALALSFAATALTGLTGWLGSELVERLGVGVYPGAHLNAPSSLSGRPASDNVADD